MIIKKIAYYISAFLVGFALFFLFAFASPALAQTSGTSCSQTGFIPCVRTKFQTKFPFDIFFNLPSGTAITCPKITLMYKEFDICFLYDSFKIIKYPIAAALLVKLYIFA
jgi:hypothetical protein